MTELDFDELDKAVNSLMAEGSTGTETPAAAPAPSDSPEVNQATPVSVASAPSQPAAPARRRGQFMDIMHPSTNMRQAQKEVKREAADIAPPQDEQATTMEDSQPAADEMSTPQAADSIETTEQQDIATMSNEQDPTSGDDEPVDTPQFQTNDDAGNPLTSPFLPDAKVEKRPLGSPMPLADESAPAVVEITPDVPTESPEQENKDVVNEEPKMPEVTPEPTPLPDELKEDIVAIEANEVVHEDAAVEPTIPAAVESAPTEVPADAPQGAGGAISQQYTEQPSTGDQTNGAIYDTNTYHQPIGGKATKKKSAALMWVLWIIVLLIVGATAGAAWFYFTTQ